MMLQIRAAGVAHFHPECLAQFTPVGYKHFKIGVLLKQVRTDAGMTQD